MTEARIPPPKKMGSSVVTSIASAAAYNGKSPPTGSGTSARQACLAVSLSLLGHYFPCG